MAAACPSPEELERLLRETLTEVEQAEVLQHLDACGDCRQRLETLASGTQDWCKKAAQGLAPNSSRLNQVMEHLRAAETLRVAASSTDQALSPGAMLRYLGDYEILEELGRGGMGVVYKARQVSLNRFVALKLILAGQLASDSEVRRFRTEAEAVAMLDHPSIVPIHEIGEHEGRHYFSMKLVEGGSLAEVIACGSRREDAQTSNASRLNAQRSAKKSEPPYVGCYQAKELAKLVTTLARAVHYAHQRGVLHRDLKPSNILLDAQSQPHLTDFGLAKMLERDSGLTHSGAVMGTPNYLAPEQAAGKAKEVTTAADVFSLGAILYELLTGRPPFQEDSVAATLQKVLHAEPPSPRSLNPAVPRDLETICLKCLEKEPARRYGSAEFLADDLDRFVCDEPILARPTTSLERMIKWTRRKPALAGSLAGLVAVFVFGFAGTVWKWSGELHQRQVAERESRRASETATRLEIDRVESLFGANDSSQALALLARLLRRQPTNQVVAERLMSALSHRSFCLPVAVLTHGPALNSLAPEERKGLGSLFPFRYPGSVICANISSDGESIVTASEDGTARLWDARTGRLKTPPLQHGAEVMWANFSGDGRKVVTASLDRTARVWDAQTGDPLTPPLAHPRAVWHAGFSPDGGKVVTACQDKTARLWGAASGQPLGQPMVHSNFAYYASFSSDGARILTASRPRSVALWEAATGAPIQVEDHVYSPESTTPFPRLNEITEQAVTMRAFSAYVRKAATNLFTTAQLKHENYVLVAAFSPDGAKVATASMDATARLWNASTGESLMPPLRHNGWVFSVDFSPDGSFLLTGSRDKTARLWSVETGRLLVEPLAHESAVLLARTAARARRIVTVSETDAAWLWAVPPTERVLLLVRFPRAATYARFSSDGQRMVVVTDQTANVLDSHTGQRLITPLQLQHGSTYPLWDAQFSPDNRSLVTVSQYGDARVWNLAAGSTQFVRFRHAGDVRLARFHPDGTRLVTASDDGTAGVWDAQSAKRLLTLRHAQRVNFAEFNHDGTAIATASWDRTARVWDAQTGQPRTSNLVHEAEVHWAGFSPDGRRLATASRDKTVRLWDPQTGRQLTPPLVHADELGERHSAEFSADGSRLVTAAGNSAQVWDVGTGRAVTAPVKHAGLIQSVRFSPDGARFVTASSDGAVAQWNTEAGQLVSETVRHTALVAYAEFSPDGRRLLTCSADETARICEVALAPLPTPTWLPELAEALAGRRMDEQNVSEVVPVQTLFTMRQRLGTASASGYYASWARWFLADNVGRTNALVADVPGRLLMFSATPETNASGPRQPFNLRVNFGDRSVHDTGLAEDFDVNFTRIIGVPYRDPKAKPEMIDLTMYYDGPLFKGFQGADPGDTLAELPRGLEVIAGVAFDLRGVIQLQGRELMRTRGPIFREQVRGVRVNQRFARVHALVGASGSEVDGTKIGAFILHHLDGERSELPILYGQHVREWVVGAPDSARQLKSAVAAWMGENRYTRTAGGQRRLYKALWKNPHPNVEVKSVDFVSSMTRCAPFLIAITVE